MSKVVTGRNRWEGEPFNPMHRVPENEEEVEIALRYNRDELTGSSMVGIYRCNRKLGDDLLTAYQKALEALVQAFQAQQASPE